MTVSVAFSPHRPFWSVFQHLAGLCVYANLLRDLAMPDVEGIAQTAAALLLLQLLIGNFARMGLKRNRPGLFQVDFGLP